MDKAILSKFFFKYFAWFITIILHPLLMPALGVYIILGSGHFSLISPEGKSLILMITIICTFALPVAFLPFFYYQKISTSFAINEKQERILPLIVTAALYYLSFYLFRRMGVPIFIQAFQLASALAVIVTLLITIKWKVSAHLVGIGGIIGLILVLTVFYHINLFFYLVISLILAGWVAFARLSLDAHTPGQVYIGLAVGFLVMVGTLVLF